MNDQFKTILKLEGLKFIQALLAYEEQRFDSMFIKGSVYEEMNADFGLFPPAKIYPLYFMGDIRKPKDKIIFIGINPGYSEEMNKKEQEYLEKAGSFEGYCTHFQYRASIARRSAYFAHIGGFLRRLGLMGQNEKMSWEWLQKHFINMDLIPYHSSDAGGIRINNLPHYKERYFIPIVKIIEYLNPKKPIFIVGFPTFEKYLTDPIFRGLIDFQKDGDVWAGAIAGQYSFIGLPFLNRVSGGKDKLVDSVRRHIIANSDESVVA